MGSPFLSSLEIDDEPGTGFATQIEPAAEN
jgi:hypothetical protein